MPWMVLPQDSAPARRGSPRPRPLPPARGRVGGVACAALRHARRLSTGVAGAVRTAGQNGGDQPSEGSPRSDEKYLSKLAALLRQAESTDNEHEAEAFMAAAQRLATATSI